jgi:hypothetical protein
MCFIIGCNNNTENDTNKLKKQTTIKEINPEQMYKNEIFSIDNKFKMTIYQTTEICDKWKDRETRGLQFICIEITRTDNLSFDVIKGARTNFIKFFDDNYSVSPVCYQKKDNPKKSLDLLFTTDAFDKFTTETGFYFSYGYSPYMKFSKHDTNNLIRSFKLNLNNKTTPLADSAWLISKGLDDYLVIKENTKKYQL